MDESTSRCSQAYQTFHPGLSPRSPPHAWLLPFRLVARLRLRPLALPLHRPRPRRAPLARILGPVVRMLGRLLPKGDDASDRGTFADGYHGKVMPLEAAIQLVTVQEDVDLGDLEQIIPYPVARDIVLQNPDHIVVLECPCRTARENPCQPLDVCLIVGEPFASFVVEHHPQRSRWISQTEAVDILRPSRSAATSATPSSRTQC